MGVVCQACGAENHGGVAVCRMCAAALPVASGAGRERSKSRPRRRSKNAAANRVTRWWLMAGLGALAVLLFWAWGPAGHHGKPAVAAATPGDTTGQRQSPVTDAASSAADSLTQATAAAEARLQASLERLAREDRERAEAQARERAAPERRPPRQAEQPQRRDQTTARAEPLPVSAATATPAVAAAANEPPAPADTRPVAVTAPDAVSSVQQRCAASGNFFSRSICQSQACADPSMAQDPVCRRLSEIEQANRRDPSLMN